MGLQLIFAVETNSKCKSDWIYIKDTIEHFYKYDRSNSARCIWTEKGGMKNRKGRFPA